MGTNRIIILGGSDVLSVSRVSHKKGFTLSSERYIIFWFTAFNMVAFKVGVHAEARFKYIALIAGKSVQKPMSEEEVAPNSVMLPPNIKVDPILRASSAE